MPMRVNALSVFSTPDGQKISGNGGSKSRKMQHGEGLTQYIHQQ